MRATQQPQRHPAFALMLVLVLFALVTGAATIVSLHATQHVRTDRERTVQLELRQMIDSGAAYAQQHRETLQRDSTPIIVDARSLAPNRRSATITISPQHNEAHELLACDIRAEVEISAQRSRSMTARVSLAEE